MVAEIPDEIIDALLDGSHTSRYVVEASYDGRPTFDRPLPLDVKGNITQSRSSRILESGRLLVASETYTSLGGRTLEPNALMDPLAPFGQELDIRLEVSLGRRVIGSTSIGRYVIDEIPDSERTARKHGRQTLDEGALVEVVFSGQLSRIDADEFTEPTSPLAGNTTWAEIRRLSTLPVQVSLDDRAMSSSIVYQNSRLDTLNDLAAHLDGFLFVTPQGVLTVREESPYDRLALPEIDLTGTIRDMGNSLSRGIYNCVVVRASGQGAQQIVAVAQIETGPLSVYGPLGRRVYNRSSPLITNQAEADAEATTYLAKVSSQRTKTVKINCLPNPLIELGDVAQALDPATKRVEVGIVEEKVWSMDPIDLMTVTLLIPQEGIPWA